MKCHPRTSNLSGWAVAALLAALLGYAPAGYAYLDPGTGSMIISAIVGLIATVALTVKTWWYRVRRLFRRRDKETGRQGKEESPSGADT